MNQHQRLPASDISDAQTALRLAARTVALAPKGQRLDALKDAANSLQPYGPDHHGQKNGGSRSPLTLPMLDRIQNTRHGQRGMGCNARIALPGGLVAPPRKTSPRPP